MEDRKHQEIDLASIASGTKNMIVDLYKRIVQLIDFTMHNIKIIIIFVVVFAVAWYGLYFVQKPYYTSIANFAHSRLNNDQCAQMITNLKNYMDPLKRNSELSQILKVDPVTATKLKSIEYKQINIELTRNFRDSVNVFIPFGVKVEVYDNTILDTLQDALLSYLESNEYSRMRKELDLELLKEDEARIDAEMAQLDSVKKLVNQAIVPRASGNGIILGQPIDPVNVSRRYIDLYLQKKEIKRRRALNNSFEVLVGFTKGENNAVPRKLSFLVIGAFVGYIVGLLFVYRRNKRKNRLIVK